jgi:hypothetical protein
LLIEQICSEAEVDKGIIQDELINKLLNEVYKENLNQSLCDCKPMANNKPDLAGSNYQKKFRILNGTNVRGGDFQFIASFFAKYI